MQEMTIRNKMFNIIYGVCHMSGGGNTFGDLEINLLIIIDGNGFLELKGFLKHDHLVYKPMQFTF